MSSAAIAILIAEKRKELEEVKQTKTQVDELYGVMDCVTSKFAKAGTIVESLGSIDGAPIDGGKTTETSTELKTITKEIEETQEDLETRIAALEREIADLEREYQEALRREEEARKAAEAAAIDEERRYFGSNVSKIIS